MSVSSFTQPVADLYSGSQVALVHFVLQLSLSRSLRTLGLSTPFRLQLTLERLQCCANACFLPGGESSCVRPNNAIIKSTEVIISMARCSMPFAEELVKHKLDKGMGRRVPTLNCAKNVFKLSQNTNCEQYGGVYMYRRSRWAGSPTSTSGAS